MKEYLIERHIGQKRFEKYANIQEYEDNLVLSKNSCKYLNKSLNL